MLGINCKLSACRTPYSRLEVAPRALGLGRRAGGKEKRTQQGVGSSPTNFTHQHLLQKHPGAGDHSASLRPHIPALESAPLLSRQHRNGPSSICPAKQERGNCDTRPGGPSKVSQVTQDMATRMLHMAQFLRRKGPIAVGSVSPLLFSLRIAAAPSQIPVSPSSWESGTNSVYAQYSEFLPPGWM